MGTFGSQQLNDGSNTEFVKGWPLTNSSEFIFLGGTDSSKVSTITTGTYEQGFIVRYTQQMNIVYAKSFTMNSIEWEDYQSQPLAMLSQDENYISVIHHYPDEDNCFTVLQTEDGNIYKSFCRTDGNSLYIVYIYTINLVYIQDYTNNIILVSDLSVANPVFSGLDYTDLTSYISTIQANAMFAQGIYLYMAGSSADGIQMYKIDIAAENMPASFSHDIALETNAQTYLQVSINSTSQYHIFCSQLIDFSTSLGYFILYTIYLETNINQAHSTFSIVQWFKSESISSILQISCGSQFYDSSLNQMAISIYNEETPGYCAITILDLTQTGTRSYTMQIFYSAQNGYQITFFTTFFLSLSSALIGGVIGPSSSNFQTTFNAVAINVPEPYYFQMGSPVQKNFTIQALSGFTPDLIIASTIPGIPIQYKISSLAFDQIYTFTIVQATDSSTQMIDIKVPNRTISFVNTLTAQTYNVGDPALIVGLGTCTYSETQCTDATFTYELLQTNGNAIPNPTMLFSASTNRVIVSTTDPTVAGTYILSYKCYLPDTFSNSQNFTINIIAASSGTTTAGNSSTTGSGSNSTSNTTSGSTNTSSGGSSGSGGTSSGGSGSANSSNSSSAASSGSNSSTGSNSTAQSGSSGSGSSGTSTGSGSSVTSTGGSTSSTSGGTSSGGSSGSSTGGLSTTTSGGTSSSVSGGGSTSGGSTGTSSGGSSSSNGGSSSNSGTGGNTISTSSTTTSAQSSSQKYQYNYAPEFLDSMIDHWVVMSGAVASLPLPTYFDANPTDKVTVSLETVASYTQFFYIQNQNTVVFNAGFPDLGDIQMIISLKDNNPTGPKQTNYLLTVTILQSPFAQMQNTYVSQVNITNYTAPTIQAFNNQSQIKVASISPNGQVVLQFEKSLNLTNLTYTEMIILRSLMVEFDDPDVQYSWNVTNVQNYSITLKIDITNPLQISKTQQGTKISIVLLNPQLFVNMKTLALVAITQTMPPQIVSSDNEILEALSKFFNSTLQSLLVTQASAQIIISQSLQIFWGFVNTQQIISHLPLLDINIPSNLYYFYQLVVGQMKFDYLFSGTLLQDTFDLNGNYPAFNDNFNDFGYNSSLAIQNMGFNTFILLMSPILIFLSYLCIAFSIYAPFFTPVANFMKRIFIFSFPLRLFIESYINIFLSAWINAYSFQIQGSYGEVFSTFISIFFLVFCVMAPFILAPYFGLQKTINKNSSIKTFYEELNTKSLLGLQYYAIYFLRRMVYVATMILLPGYCTFQIISFQLQSIFQMIYIISVKPFETSIQNRIEIMNEMLVLVHSWCLILFTDVLTDPYLRYDIGWGLLLSIFVITVANIILNLIHIVRTGILLFKKAKHLLRTWTSMRNSKTVTMRTLMTTDRGLFMNSEINNTGSYLQKPSSSNLFQTQLQSTLKLKGIFMNEINQKVGKIQKPFQSKENIKIQNIRQTDHEDQIQEHTDDENDMIKDQQQNQRHKNYKSILYLSKDTINQSIDDTSVIFNHGSKFEYQRHKIIDNNIQRQQQSDQKQIKGQIKKTKSMFHDEFQINQLKEKANISNKLKK